MVGEKFNWKNILTSFYFNTSIDTNNKGEMHSRLNDRVRSYFKGLAFPNRFIQCLNLDELVSVQKELIDAGFVHCKVDLGNYNFLNFETRYEYPANHYLFIRVLHQFASFSVETSPLPACTGVICTAKEFFNEFVKDNIIFATHIDQDNYLWNISFLGYSPKCFINNEWIDLEIEDHIILSDIEENTNVP